MPDKLIGRNAVMEALRSGRRIFKVTLIRDGKGKLKEVLSLAVERGIPVEYASRRDLDVQAEGGNHQGVIAEVEPVKPVDISEILAEGDRRGEAPLLLLLDEIQDPHNLGSLMRTADAAGFHGVVITKRRSAGLTATVAKTSAGAVEYVPIAQVTNLARTMDWLKEQGLWIVGADMDGDSLCYESDLTGPLALVIGGEGKGLGRLTKEKCDFLVRLPMWGRINSLNASVAGALMMYEIRRQRNFTKRD